MGYINPVTSVFYRSSSSQLNMPWRHVKECVLGASWCEAWTTSASFSLMGRSCSELRADVRTSHLISSGETYLPSEELMISSFVWQPLGDYTDALHWYSLTSHLTFICVQEPPRQHYHHHTRWERVIVFKAKTKTTNLKALLLTQWARQLSVRLWDWVCNKCKGFLHLCGSYLLTWQSRMALGTLNTV